MLTFAAKYGKNVFSQNGEDGIIEECIKRILTDHIPRVAVEFGGHDGFFCSNTRNLTKSGYWKGWMYDINPGSQEVQKKEITPENVNELPECSVLSIDCDGPDYWIWKAYNGKPAIVIIEINSSIPPTVDEIPGDRGASYKSMVELAQSKGYFLVAHTGNLVLVLNKYRPLFPEITGDPIKDHELYFNKRFL